MVVTTWSQKHSESMKPACWIWAALKVTAVIHVNQTTRENLFTAFDYHFVTLISLHSKEYAVFLYIGLLYVL